MARKIVCRIYTAERTKSYQGVGCEMWSFVEEAHQDQESLVAVDDFLSLQVCFCVISAKVRRSSREQELSGEPPRESSFRRTARA